MYTPILLFKPRLHLIFFLCMCYTFSSTKSYDIVNSGEMVIYVFLLEFFSPYNQKHMTSRSRSCDQKL